MTSPEKKRHFPCSEEAAAALRMSSKAASSVGDRPLGSVFTSSVDSPRALSLASSASPSLPLSLSESDESLSESDEFDESEVDLLAAAAAAGSFISTSFSFSRFCCSNSLTVGRIFLGAAEAVGTMGTAAAAAAAAAGVS